MIPKFFLNEMKDNFIRENFKRLSDYFRTDPVPGAQFRFFSITATGSSAQTFNHNLGYIPKDLILLAISSGQTVVFAYDSFTTKAITFTPSGSCTIRLLLGTYNPAGSVNS